MRDQLIHAYFRVDYELVWDTVQEDLPVLEEKLRYLIAKVNYHPIHRVACPSMFLLTGQRTMGQLTDAPE